MAMSVDVPRTGYGVKSDEATYVATALSAAYDGNLSFERRDLERFAESLSERSRRHLSETGQSSCGSHPSRCFRSSGSVKLPDPDANRLYFGKALIYPLFAAPFVRILGLNGLLLFHVLLLAAVGILGYLFLAPRSSTLASLLITTGFLGASVLPVYGAFLMPEIFNVSVVFVAYFLWLYKEANPGAGLGGRWTDLVAALLLGMATYSKPLPIGLLVAPLVVLAWLRRRWFWGVTIGALAVVTAAALFCLTAAVSGEFNYQGGDRRTFYGTFPFDKSVDHLGSTRHFRGHRRRRDSGRAHVTRNAESVRAQRRLFPRRSSFWVRSVFLPRCRGDRHLAAVAHASRAVAHADVSHVRDLCCRVAARAAVHVERGRRTARQPIPAQCLSHAVLSGLTDRINVAGADVVGWRDIVYGKNAGQPVRRRRISVAGHRTRSRAASARRVDDGQRPTGEAGSVADAHSLRTRPHLASVFPRSERLSAGTNRHVGFGDGPRGHYRSIRRSNRPSRGRGRNGGPDDGHTLNGAISTSVSESNRKSSRHLMCRRPGLVVFEATRTCSAHGRRRGLFPISAIRHHAITEI